MELQGLQRSIHSSIHRFGGEKEQMLNLNQRLETYLNRVKLLDEENSKLVQEIQALRRNHRGNQERCRFLDEELRNARQEVDAVWKERVYAEVDMARLMEEMQSLDVQLQKETQAQAEAKAKTDQSRRELEEERRAQMWLREKVNQLEHEMKTLILSHQEDLANMEAMLMQPRVMRPPARAVHHGPNLRDFEEELSQRAARAWEEAGEKYQEQLERLEEAVNETRQRLVQVNKEKSESVMKIQSLDREMTGLQDLREHLENTVDQQRENHCRDIEMLQERLEDLEREKEALAQKMEQLLLENRGLVQMKTSLSLEVATYRALLDNESLKGHISLQKQPRNIYSKEAVFSPWGVKDNYQMFPSPKTTSTSIANSMTGKTKPQAIMVTPTLYQKCVPRKEILEISKERVEDKRVYQQPELTPYPKVLKNGAVEDFRPQEVHEKVTYAEPLSPPDEQEYLKTLGAEKEGHFWNDTVDLPAEEKACIESQISYQDEPSLNSGAVPLEETGQHLTEPALIENLSCFPVKSELLDTQIKKEHFEDAKFEEELEQPDVGSNLSHQVETVCNNEQSINEANPELFEEPITEDSCTVMLKSEDIPFENEETEKLQPTTDTVDEVEYANQAKQVCEESNLTHQIQLVPYNKKPFNEANPEMFGEPLTVDSCNVPLQTKMQEIPCENEETEKPQAPVDAWVEENVSKMEKACAESNFKYQVESESFNETVPELAEEPIIDESYSTAVKSELQKTPEIDEIEKPQAPIVASTEKESVEETKDVEEQQESSDSETQAFVEPNFDTKSSSPESEGSLKNQLGDIINEDFTFDSVGVTREDVSPPREKLYPDGEEMDTWDSVIEQNQDVKEDNVEEPEEAMRQHAEPEEDISAREAQQALTQQPDMIQDIEINTKMEPQTDLKEENILIEEDLPDDEQEDSQHVSVSWRTELEGDSYAQDNTLADTRPLIRYKSDDTDANTQASHVDDADDSSDSEQDKKVGEMVSGAWTEDKARKFGTMEDLCEEVEGDVLDEEFDLEYLRKDGKDDEQGDTHDDSQEEEIKTVVEEELDTDKLVEEELENLTTECYTTHFALHQVSAKDTSALESLAEQPKAWKEALEDMAEPLDMEDFLTSEVEQKGDELTEVTQTSKKEDEEFEELEGDKHDTTSKETNCDTTEDINEARKYFVRSSSQEQSIEQNEQENMEETQSIVMDLLTTHESQSVVINQLDEPTSETHPGNGVKIMDTTTEESFVPEEANTEFLKVPSTTKWKTEVENPTAKVDCDEIKTVSDLAQKGPSMDDNDCDSLSPTNKQLSTSSENIHEEVDLFIEKDSKALLKTNSKAKLDDLYCIGGDDFWMSPLETGATFQPDDVDVKHAEWGLGFGDVECRESKNVLSKSDLAFEQKVVTQIKSAIQGETVHSEESEYDSEVMSSGEE